MEETKVPEGEVTLSFRSRWTPCCDYVANVHSVHWYLDPPLKSIRLSYWPDKGKAEILRWCKKTPCKWETMAVLNWAADLEPEEAKKLAEEVFMDVERIRAIKEAWR